MGISISKEKHSEEILLGLELRKNAREISIIEIWLLLRSRRSILIQLSSVIVFKTCLWRRKKLKEEIKSIMKKKDEEDKKNVKHGLMSKHARSKNGFKDKSKEKDRKKKGLKLRKCEGRSKLKKESKQLKKKKIVKSKH